MIEPRASDTYSPSGGSSALLSVPPPAPLQLRGMPVSAHQAVHSRDVDLGCLPTMAPRPQTQAGDSLPLTPSGMHFLSHHRRRLRARSEGETQESGGGTELPAMLLPSQHHTRRISMTGGITRVLLCWDVGSDREGLSRSPCGWNPSAPSILSPLGWLHTRWGAGGGRLGASCLRALQTAGIVQGC